MPKKHEDETIDSLFQVEIHLRDGGMLISKPFWGSDAAVKWAMAQEEYDLGSDNVNYKLLIKLREDGIREP